MRLWEFDQRQCVHSLLLDVEDGAGAAALGVGVALGVSAAGVAVDPLSEAAGEAVSPLAGGLTEP